MNAMTGIMNAILIAIIVAIDGKHERHDGYHEFIISNYGFEP